MTFWVLLILAVIVLTTYLGPQQEEAEGITYTEYRSLLNRDAFQKIEITERRLVGTLKQDETGGEQQKQVQTVLPPVTKEMVSEWEGMDLTVEFREESTNWFGMILTSILPWVVLIGIWIFFLRRMQGGGSRGLFSFGKNKAKLMIENKPKVTFEDVAGSNEAKEELQEIIQFLKDPKKFSRLGGRIPKGALLVGPPGTGKTLFARAVAGEAGVPFFSMSGADFVEMFVGVGASRVRDLFEQGKKHAPCIIFIDELDAVGRQRGAGLGGGHDEREQTLNQLLVEMDGFESNEGVILIAATNRPDVLDPALLRPGRFDRQIVVDRPDVRGREGILRVHTRNIPLDEDVDLKVLAKGTPGLAGAELANLANEAALLAARRNAEKVSMRDFEDAKDKVMMGTERKSMLISDEEKRLTAFHEAGHVLVAKYTPGSDPVHKVTIIPRGRALGVTHYLPIDEKHSWSKKYIEGKMIHLMGGRAAERLVFDDYTNGAASDIKQATDIARKMVCDWGMSDKIGPLALSNSDQEVFLGREMSRGRVYSEATALDIDREVKRFVLTAQDTAEQILQDYMQQLNDLAEALLEREILDGAEIDLILEGKELPPVPVKRNGGGKSEEKKEDRLEKVDEVLSQLEGRLQENRERRASDESAEDETEDNDAESAEEPTSTGNGKSKGDDRETKDDSSPDKPSTRTRARSSSRGGRRQDGGSRENRGSSNRSSSGSAKRPPRTRRKPPRTDDDEE
ncbi:ATP-dependent zinc metalloprotease FtsH [bacterium]|nr:ATP-dependent zinc metalloprotease FtsH [bacterium]